MRIYTRLAVLTLFISTVALGSATLLWNQSLRGERQQELEDRLLDHARILSSLLPSPDDQAQINLQLLRLNQETRSRLTVIRADGKVLAESHLDPAEVGEMENHLQRPEIQDALRSGIGRAIRESPTLGIPMAYVAVRWGPADAPHGVVRAALPMTRVIQEANRGRGRLLVVVLGSLVLAVTLGAVAAQRISRPLARLSVRARRIAGGELDRRLELEGGPETREFAQAVNHLADSVQGEIRELAAERERLVQLLQGMPDGIIALDREGRITVANRSASELLSLDTHVQGKTPVEAVSSGELQQAVDRALNAEGASSIELTVLEPIRRVLSVDLVPLVEGGLVVVLHDVTRLRRLEEARREMVANIGHELRTPLASILGYLETLEHSGDLAPEDRGRFLSIISRNARRLERLVKDLSQLSRLEMVAEELPLQPLDLAGVVMAATEVLSPVAGGKDIRILTELPPDLPPVLADRTGLETVVLNLIDNAVRVSPPGSSVAVRLTREDQRLHLSVADEGPGIPRDLRERVFERFYRMDSGRATQEGGSGLGLALVKHTVIRLGGTVSVEDAPGGGACFRVSLPESP